MNIAVVYSAMLAEGDAGTNQVQAYLPDNYRVLPGFFTFDGFPARLIVGEDHLGWTLEDYVIPRFASGMYRCELVTDSANLGWGSA